MNSQGIPTTSLEAALVDVGAMIGRQKAALTNRGLAASTLIIVLVWLRHASAAQPVAAAILAQRKLLGVREVLRGPRLALRFSAASYDSRTPDLVVYRTTT